MTSSTISETSVNKPFPNGLIIHRRYVWYVLLHWARKVGLSQDIPLDISNIVHQFQMFYVSSWSETFKPLQYKIETVNNMCFRVRYDDREPGICRTELPLPQSISEWRVCVYQNQDLANFVGVVSSKTAIEMYHQNIHPYSAGKDALVHCYGLLWDRKEVVLGNHGKTYELNYNWDQPAIAPGQVIRVVCDLRTDRECLTFYNESRSPEKHLGDSQLDYTIKLPSNVGDYWYPCIGIYGSFVCDLQFGNQWIELYQSEKNDKK